MGTRGGAKLAIASIRRRVDAAKSSEEVLQIVFEHKARFQDAQGRPYEWVRELASYCNRRKHALKREAMGGGSGVPPGGGKEEEVDEGLQQLREIGVSVKKGELTQDGKRNLAHSLTNHFSYFWDGDRCYTIRRLNGNKLLLCNGKCNKLAMITGDTSFDYLGPIIDVNTPVVYHNKPLRKIDMVALDKALHKKFDRMNIDQLLDYMENKLFRSIDDGVKKTRYTLILRPICIACEKMNAIVGCNVVKDYHFCRKKDKNCPNAFAFVDSCKKELSLCPGTFFCKQNAMERKTTKMAKSKQIIALICSGIMANLSKSLLLTSWGI